MVLDDKRRAGRDNVAAPKPQPVNPKDDPHDDCCHWAGHL